jgi:hypothetical protein
MNQRMIGNPAPGSSCIIRLITSLNRFEITTQAHDRSYSQTSCYVISLLFAEVLKRH